VYKENTSVVSSYTYYNAQSGMSSRITAEVRLKIPLRRQHIEYVDIMTQT